MKTLRAAPLLLALLLLFTSGCVAPTADFLPSLSPQEEAEIDAALDVHLGLLKDQVSETERSRARIFLAQLWPLRTRRLERGIYEKSPDEARLWEQLNRLLERYTIKYTGGELVGGFGSSGETYLAQYQIKDGSTIQPDRGFAGSRPAQRREEDYSALWDQMLSMLPSGAYEDFDRFTVFTDGEAGVLAYVVASDSQGETWEIAVDPADAKDYASFAETIIHEYCHYLTLNDEQVIYTDEQTTDTYNEDGMVTRPGSYLDDFYQAFWTGYLDDRRANPDSYNFFLRHEDEFITDYAATDPSEDIAECFIYFVVYPRQTGDEVWMQKLNFFYQYPELVEFRAAVRDCLGLEGA